MYLSLFNEKLSWIFFSAITLQLISRCIVFHFIARNEQKQIFIRLQSLLKFVSMEWCTMQIFFDLCSTTIKVQILLSFIMELLNFELGTILVLWYPFPSLPDLSSPVHKRNPLFHSHSISSLLFTSQLSSRSFITNSLSNHCLL